MKARLHPVDEPRRVGRGRARTDVARGDGQEGLAAPIAGGSHATLDGRRPGLGRGTLVAAIVSGLVACAAYLPALGFGFVRDDHELLLDGSLLRAQGNLFQVLVSDYWSAAFGASGLWRPWALFTLWLDGHLSGWSPAWFHASNLVVHGLTTSVLVLAVAAYGGGTLAMWLAGLWFALMPAHVESVAWIAGRTDVWCGLFALSALVLARGGAGARKAAPVAFAIALLSKESAAALAPVLALEAWYAAGNPRRWLRALVPYVAVLALWAWLHSVLAPPLAAAERTLDGAARLWTALAVPAWELRFLLPGVGHGPDWMIAPLSGPAPAALAGTVLRLAAAAAMTWLILRRDRLSIPLAVAWCPLIGMTVLALAGVVFSGERHVYLASAGAAWVAAAGIERMTRSDAVPRAFARYAIVAVVLVLLWNARETLANLPMWRDDEAMYAAMTRTQPRNATGPLGQALARIDRGDEAGAWEALERAESIDSTRFEIPLYRAGILLRRGRAEEALGAARSAVLRGGWNRDAMLIQALALQRLDRWPEARTRLDELWMSFPGDADVAAALRAQRAGEAGARGGAPGR